MNATQENKLSMCLAVQKVCSANNGVWKGLPSFVDAFSDFEANLSSLQDALGAQVTNITGFTREKESLEELLIDKAIAVARAIFAYAEKMNNKPLREKVNYAPSDLKNTRDTVRISISQVIHDEANGVLGDLGDYGIDADGLEELQKAIKDYTTAVSAPRSATTEKKKATGMISELFGVIDGILKNRMDKLIEIFKKSNFDFYKQYFNGRMIIELGGRNTVLKGVVSNKKDSKGVEGATVELKAKISKTDSKGAVIKGGEVKAKTMIATTNKAGEFIFEGVAAGEYELRISKEGFETAEADKVIVERGKVNEVNVGISPKG